METRLTARTASAAEAVEPQVDVSPPSDSEEAVVAADVSARSLNGTESESINVWPDESAEASFMAEARERGEAPAKPPAPADDAGENDAKNLPPLEDLVNRLPADVREALDDLFRVKFTAVRKIPAKLLKK